MMVLAVGIVGILRIFSEALYVNGLNQERVMAQSAMKRIVFPWLAYASEGTFPEEGGLSLPLEVNGADTNLSVDIEPERLVPSSEKEEKNTDSVKQVKLQKNTKYYKLKFRVTRGHEKEVLDFETVAVRLKQQGAKT